MVRETVAVDKRARAATSLMFMLAQITTTLRRKNISVCYSICNRLQFTLARGGSCGATRCWRGTTNRGGTARPAANDDHLASVPGDDTSDPRQRPVPRHGIAGTWRQNIFVGAGRHRPRVPAATGETTAASRLWRQLRELRRQRV